MTVVNQSGISNAVAGDDDCARNRRALRNAFTAIKATTGLKGVEEQICLMLLCFIAPKQSKPNIQVQPENEHQAPQAEQRNREQEEPEPDVQRANPHVLLEGSPGTGKGELAKGFAKVVAHMAGRAVDNRRNDYYERVQGTNETIPSDFIGREQPGGAAGGAAGGAGGPRTWEFAPGPLLKFEDSVDANRRPYVTIVNGEPLLKFEDSEDANSRPLCFLVDELNRLSRKTDSALLEAMAESTVHLTSLLTDKNKRILADFFLIAMQNPAFMLGTEPTGEALADRFMVRLAMTFDLSKIADALKAGQAANLGAPPNPTVNWSEIRSATVAGWSEIAGLIERFIGLTHPASAFAHGHVEGALCHDPALRQLVDKNVAYGASMRGAMAMRDLACSVAWCRGPNENGEVKVMAGDVYEVAPYVLNHRIKFHQGAEKPVAECIQFVRDLVEIARRVLCVQG